jgi:hypothetical protein
LLGTFPVSSSKTGTSPKLAAHVSRTQPIWVGQVGTLSQPGTGQGRTAAPAERTPGGKRAATQPLHAIADGSRPTRIAGDGVAPPAGSVAAGSQASFVVHRSGGPARASAAQAATPARPATRATSPAPLKGLPRKDPTPSSVKSLAPKLASIPSMPSAFKPRLAPRATTPTATPLAPSASPSTPPSILGRVAPGGLPSTPEGGRPNAGLTGPTFPRPSQSFAAPTPVAAPLPARRFSSALGTTAPTPAAAAVAPVAAISDQDYISAPPEVKDEVRAAWLAEAARVNAAEAAAQTAVKVDEIPDEWLADADVAFIDEAALPTVVTTRSDSIPGAWMAEAASSAGGNLDPQHAAWLAEAALANAEESGIHGSMASAPMAPNGHPYLAIAPAIPQQPHQQQQMAAAPMRHYHRPDSAPWSPTDAAFFAAGEALENESSDVEMFDDLDAVSLKPAGLFARLRGR